MYRWLFFVTAILTLALTEIEKIKFMISLKITNLHQFVRVYFRQKCIIQLNNENLDFKNFRERDKTIH